MKKLLILPAILGLAACDKPNTSIELACARDKHAVIDVYDNYAMMSLDGAQAMRLDKIGENMQPSEVFLTFKGYGWIMNMQVLRDRPMMRKITIATPNDYKLYGCDVLVPFKTNYKPATDIEKCMEFINANVYSTLTDTLIIHNQQQVIYPDGHIESRTQDIDIPAEDATSLSPNWDYSNIKYYNSSDGIQDYEKDACDVKKRLQEYMEQKGIHKTINPDGTLYQG